MIVANTTLISYFTIEGDLTEAAVAVREKDPAWAAPLLWESEFANVLWLYVRRGTFGLDLALQHLDTAQDLVAGHTYAVAIAEALRLAAESGCTTYDCQYVTLARQLEVPLVIHDQEVLNAFPKTALHPGDFIAA
jgi:predicted nucleic acid-binding protein